MSNVKTEECKRLLAGFGGLLIDLWVIWALGMSVMHFVHFSNF